MSLALDAVLAASGDEETVTLSGGSVAVLFYALDFLEKRFNWLDTSEEPLDEVTDADWDAIEKLVGNAAYELMNPMPIPFPGIVYLDALAGEVYIGGARAYTVIAQMINGFGVTVTPLAQNNALAWWFFARSGVYTLTILTITSSAYGRLHPLVDGVLDSNFIELYAAGTTYNAIKQISVSVLTDGDHYLALKCSEKHASSSNYNFFISDLWLTRIGDLP